MAGIVTKGQLGYEDLSVGTGTISRATSTGGSQTIHQIPLPSQSVTLVDISTVQSLSNKTMVSPTTTGTDNGAETLQNKTLNGAANGNAVTLLNQQGALGALTGNAADQTIFTYTLPANTLGAGKGLRITGAWLHNSGTASVTYKLFLGANAAESPAWANFDNSKLDFLEWRVFNNTGVQNSQQFLRSSILNLVAVGFSPGAVNGGPVATDFSQQQVIKVTFNVAATDQVTPKFWIVELIQ